MWQTVRKLLPCVPTGLSWCILQILIANGPATAPRAQDPGPGSGLAQHGAYAATASISFAVPRIFSARRMLYAGAVRLKSARTCRDHA